MSELKNNYTKVPNRLITSKLPNSALRVILYLLTYQNKKEIFPSISTIALDCHISEPTVKRALRKLKKEKFITVNKKYHTDSRSNAYLINFDEIDPDCVLTSEEIEKKESDLKKAHYESKLKSVKKQAPNFDVEPDSSLFVN
jgi:DNA-binding transcriptional regulator YhcF (GntR family)